MSIFWITYLFLALVTFIVWLAYIVYLKNDWKTIVLDHLIAAIICSLLWWLVWPAAIVLSIKQRRPDKRKNHA